MRKMRCYDCSYLFEEKDAGYICDTADFWGGSCSLPGYAVCPSCDSENIGYEEE